MEATTCGAGDKREVAASRGFLQLPRRKIVHFVAGHQYIDQAGAAPDCTYTGVTIT